MMLFIMPFKFREERNSGRIETVGLDPCLGDWVLEPARIHSLNSMGHNWWTSCACMGGILALSLQNELPEAKQGAEAVYEALPQWFDFAGDVLQQKPKSFDADGGCMKASIMPISGFRKHYSFVWHG